MFDWLDDLPRVRLGHLPTPLEPMDRFSDWIGGTARPRVWLKRDDCTGLATGGNKTRKLEYLLGDAREGGFERVVTFGAVQSNHARQTAAACARLGLECHLVLVRQVRWPHPGYETAGNVLLDRLLGAKLHVLDPASADADIATLLGELAPAYVIPAGGSNVVGALGYVRCMAELVADCRSAAISPVAVVHASSSGGTQAGLIGGAACVASPPRVVGVNVYAPDTATVAANVDRLVAQLGERFLPPGVQTLPADVLDGHVGDGYGIPTEAGLAAIEALARLEGVLLDPVYSGKGMAGLVALIRGGAFDGADDLVFVHTGGTAALAVYETAF